MWSVCLLLQYLLAWQEVYVEGIVRGNVFANDVKIKNNGMLLGDIQCMCLTLDPTASVKVRACLNCAMTCAVFPWPCSALVMTGNGCDREKTLETAGVREGKRPQAGADRDRGKRLLLGQPHNVAGG